MKRNLKMEQEVKMKNTKRKSTINVVAIRRFYIQKLLFFSNTTQCPTRLSRNQKGQNVKFHKKIKENPIKMILREITSSKYRNKMLKFLLE